ncbi:MAG TPA: transglycosylase SLT domain-containing protein [Polyangiaceae bacterium]|nr:transglycosylase SLT domain-containing protein [Polyangiaceae bacterium]
MRNRSVAFALTLVGALTLPAWASADIYSYVDKNGVVHYRTRPSNAAPRSKPAAAADDGGPAPRRPAPAAPGDRSPERFRRYDEYIRQAAALYQIPEALVRAVISVESDYDPRAVSPVGAVGLMQLMPETARRMEVRDAVDPRENIFGGVRYLRSLANLFNGDLALTVAGYNAGEGAVMRHGGIPPYAETQEYVVRVLANYRRYRSTPDPVEAGAGPPP